MKEAQMCNRDPSSAHWHGTARCRPQAHAQHGAIAVMSAILLVVIIGFFALALDMARLYNRRAELHTLADAAALAAAKQLNGTPEGISAAVAAARGVVEHPEDGPKYQYINDVSWSDSALSFSTSPDGSAGWKTDGEARTAPAGLLYVKVDTNALDAAHGSVSMFFAPVLSSAFTEVKVGHVTVAGKSRVHVTPLAVCAMSPTARAKRVNPAGTQYDELVEYGFRRGISYNLMNLNPNGNSAISFQVDPIALPGGAAAHFSTPVFQPYICSGTVALPRVTGETVGVQSPFPIATYFSYLNSRFDPYTGPCNVHSAPPDANVKPFPFASVSWMNKKATMQSAMQDPSTTLQLRTVADADPPNHPLAANYGAIWSFARPVPWSSYESKGLPEPAEGYPPFAATTTVWRALYGADADAGTYPASTPYLEARGANYVQTPAGTRRPGVQFRRVLNIPLLACPVSGSHATVLAIGKFLMTVPATSTALHAEFGGLTTEDRSGGRVEIYQ